MQLQNILTLERTVSGASASSKKRVLEIIAEHICKDVSAFDNEELFQRFNAREKLGSTGIGKGIAIPHCRVPNCLGITGALFTLDKPVAFDAIDDQPVDILFVLMVPEEACDDHLQALSMMAELFSAEDYCQSLRATNSNQELFDAALQPIATG
ncbi:Nitrogen regulatory protein [Sinobacterium norvegicum]|uniref:Nitrogen regulatory protein n=1 Tax=Sinobacterium norvegicum TaxID=1641715 RepID=A0ABM9AJC0_9GAMM|nr:PTS IIA-like nitrogen regulatory protein PtsN [Sinobacterium norvegicum]CAH0993330.1 Nitrogen regulatory protein [Sinobacterium norvegicum]